MSRRSRRSIWRLSHCHCITNSQRFGYGPRGSIVQDQRISIWPGLLATMFSPFRIESYLYSLHDATFVCLPLDPRQISFHSPQFCRHHNSSFLLQCIPVVRFCQLKVDHPKLHFILGLTIEMHCARFCRVYVQACAEKRFCFAKYQPGATRQNFLAT